MGVGVYDLREAWEWYIRAFGMDCRIFEDEAEARLMLPYTGGEPRSRHAVLAMNLEVAADSRCGSTREENRNTVTARPNWATWESSPAR